MAETESTSQNEAENLVESCNDLAVHLHGLFAEAKGNVFFSPFYLSATMVMVLGEAKARGQDYISTGVNEVLSAYQQHLTSMMKSMESCISKFAISLLNRTGSEVQELFKSVLSESFEALIIEVDPETDTSEITEQINEWVDEKTNGMIPKQIESLDPAIDLVFLNGVCFKGAWLHTLDETLTSPENFYNNGDEDQAKIVDMMHMKGFFLFAEKETFQALQLPYLGEEIAMLILLPLNKDGLEALEATITPSFIHDLSPDLCERKVDVSLPRFRLEYSQRMGYSKEGIKKLGSDVALKYASDDSQGFVCDILLKAVLEVDEKGVEEATVSNGSIEEFDEGEYATEFTVDHPFAFVIYDRKIGLMIFMGRVEEL